MFFACTRESEVPNSFCDGGVIHLAIDRSLAEVGELAEGRTDLYQRCLLPISTCPLI